MVRRKSDYYELSFEQLLQSIDSEGPASKALDRYHEFKEQGVSAPEISYSPIHGYRVRDPFALPKY
jgi:hypothetical protein